MSQYYAFRDEKKIRFVKTSSLSSALSIAKKEERVFKRVAGIPNPWWVHPIKNGKVDYETIFKSIPR